METELDSRYDDVDVDSILARCRRQTPVNFSRKRCLYQAPEFIKRLPSTEEVEEGSTVTFACKVVGFPAPTVKWYIDDEVLTSEARAKTDSEDSGIHSIKIKDVSKCDAGIYTIHASNLEGSSKSMLYISVKARSKRRNKKKKKTGNVACAPFFPAIIEREAEEQKAMLEIELQPESPLTPLYCTISRKAPVMWPEFLGDWAYHEDQIPHRGEIEGLEIECEDVFDSETEETIPGGLTFVSTAYAEVNEPTQELMNSNNNKDTIQINAVNGTEGQLDLDTKYVDINSGFDNTNMPADEEQADNLRRESETRNSTNVSLTNGTLKTASKSKDNVCDILNNNDKNISANKNEHNGWAVTDGSHDTHSTYQTEVKQLYCEPCTVSSISVHRSYAKGDTSSSVARRSPSPFSRSRNLMTYSQNGLELCNDTSTLQNLNNERILHRMNQRATFYHRFWTIFRSLVTCKESDDCWLEIILFVCGSTFLALCFDLSPTTFVLDIILALIVKVVLSYVLNES